MLTRLTDKGQIHFIVWHGVLGFGGLTALLYTVLTGWVRGFEAMRDDVAMASVLFPIGGIGWGAITWRRMLRERERLRSGRSA